MSTLWCLKWYMFHSSWIQHCPVWHLAYWIFRWGKQHLYSAVWWGLENKNWSLLCILSWSRSLKWIRLTSTSWGFVCQESLSYSCSTMLLLQSKFSRIAGRESVLPAGSGPWSCTQEQSTTTFSGPCEKKVRYLLTHDTKWLCYVCRGLKGLLIKSYWFTVFSLVWSFLISKPPFTLHFLEEQHPHPPHFHSVFKLPESHGSVLMSNSLVSWFLSLIHKFPFEVNCFLKTHGFLSCLQKFAFLLFFHLHVHAYKTN